VALVDALGLEVGAEAVADRGAAAARSSRLSSASSLAIFLLALVTRPCWGPARRLALIRATRISRQTLRRSATWISWCTSGKRRAMVLSISAGGLMPWQSVSGSPVWQGPCAGWRLLVRKGTEAEAAH